MIVSSADQLMQNYNYVTATDGMPDTKEQNTHGQQRLPKNTEGNHKACKSTYFVVTHLPFPQC